MMNINIKKLNDSAKLPEYATDGSGCFDLFSCGGGILREGESLKLGTGLSFEVPEHYVMLIFSRSGHGFNHGVRLANCTGIIDSAFKGEVQVKLHRDFSLSDAEIVFPSGSRIAQALILPVPRITFTEEKEFPTTHFGSAGDV